MAISWAMVPGLEQVLALVPVLVKEAEAMGGAGPEGARAAMAPRAVAVAAMAAAQVAEKEAAVAGMGRPRATGPPAAKAKVCYCGM